MNEIEPTEAQPAKKRWLYSWGRAEWVPVGLLAFWVVGCNLSFNFFDINFSNAWYLLPFETMSALASSGVILVVVWGTLSTQNITNRYLYTIFAMLFIFSQIIAKQITVLLISTGTTILLLWLALSWWRNWKGWQLVNLHRPIAFNEGIQFSIKDILIWTTASALIMTWIGMLRKFYGVEDFRMVQIPLNMYLIQILSQPVDCVPPLLLSIVPMMDRRKIPKRSTLLFTIDLLMRSPILIANDEWYFQMLTIIYSVLGTVGAFLAGLIMRWAGYRIEKPRQTVIDSE